MENFQSKLQKGLSNVQKGLEEGKTKFQTSQELINLKDEVRRLEELRTSSILDLGELSYEKIRNKDIDEELINSIGNKILELDKEIFILLQEIDEKSQKEESTICECGSSLTPGDKFCKECGKKIESIEKDFHGETIVCSRCSAKIPSTNKFCNCCGIKI